MWPSPPLKLTAEKYTAHVLVRQQHEKGTEKLLCAQMGRTFHVRHTLLDIRFGVFHEPATWLLREGAQPSIEAVGAQAGEELVRSEQASGR